MERKMEVGKTKDRVVRSKNFVEMRASLTAAESDILDIIFCIMDSEKEEDNEKLTYVIDAHDFVGLFFNNKGEPMTVKRIYENLRNGSEGLYKIDIRFTEDTDNIKSGIAFRVVTTQGWTDGDYRLGINLSPTFKRIMVNEKKKNAGYALYGVRNQFALSGAYAKRLYPMLMRFRSTGIRYDNFDELKDKLGISDSLQQSKCIKIFEKAIAEINEYTDIMVSLQAKKASVRGGYKVQTLTFNITEKISDADNKADELTEAGKYVLKVLGKHINPNDAERIADAVDGDKKRVDEIAAFIENYNGEIKDTTGLIMSYIKENWEPGRKKEKESKKNNFNSFSNQRSYTNEDLINFEKQLLLRKDDK